MTTMVERDRRGGVKIMVVPLFTMNSRERGMRCGLGCVGEIGTPPPEAQGIFVCAVLATVSVEAVCSCSNRGEGKPVTTPIGLLAPSGSVSHSSPRRGDVEPQNQSASRASPRNARRSASLASVTRLTPDNEAGTVGVRNRTKSNRASRSGSPSVMSVLLCASGE